MGVELEEQETVITFGRQDSMAEIYTSDRTMMTKLDKKVIANKGGWKIKESNTISGKIVSKTYICPKKLLSFRNQIAQRDFSGNPAVLKRWREEQKTKRGEG